VVKKGIFHFKKRAFLMLRFSPPCPNREHEPSVRILDIATVKSIVSLAFVYSIDRMPQKLLLVVLLKKERESNFGGNGVSSREEAIYNLS